jgi:acylphosphatase
MNGATAVHAYVEGRVQGVFFRQQCRQEARRLGLIGWVRNLPDGRVEVWAQGGHEPVERLVEWLWAGPPHATVTGVESDLVEPDPTLQDFLVVN